MELSTLTFKSRYSWYPQSSITVLLKFYIKEKEVPSTVATFILLVGVERGGEGISDVDFEPKNIGVFEGC